ncbi:MAG: queuosine 5'-phosphate N-glycosylase/hydrolase [Syntrophobacteria bacterium]
MEKSQQVRINPAAIPPFVKSIRGEIPPLPQGPAPYHYFDGTLVTAQWIFVLDILNHCFWPDAGSAAWKIHYKGEILSGYWALAASLTRAMEEKIPIHRAETLAVLNRKTVDHIFRGRGEIPLLDERLANLQQAGQVLLDRFQGNFLHVLEEARGSATQLVLVVTAAFPSFNDTAAYRGKPVYFYKRAQLLTLDLWCAFSGKSWGALEDLDQLTAFADYKLPQVLRHLDIIRYTPELSRRIDNLVQLAPGSPEEVEIRLATIRAVELIRQELAQEGNAVTCAQLDNWLWTLGQRSAYRSRPYHRTRTVFY